MGIRGKQSRLTIRSCAREERGMLMAEPVYRDHKSRLFVYLFGSEEHRDWTLSVYNAIHNTHYTDPELLQIVTLGDTIYMSMKNDVSFLLSDATKLILELWEHQSSPNPNMPLRDLSYLDRHYSKYVSIMDYNVYGSKLIPLPPPKLVTFYNGRRDEPNEQILRLSDAFLESIRQNLLKTGMEAAEAEEEARRILAEVKPDVEVTVRMININYGRSESVLEASNPLQGYAWLIDQVRQNQKTMEIGPAVDKAILDMPESYVIQPFLHGHRSEVKDMLITEYDEEKTMRQFRDEGYEEGREEGRQETILKSIRNVMKTLHVTVEKAMEVLMVPVENRGQYASLLSQ